MNAARRFIGIAFISSLMVACEYVSPIYLAIESAILGPPVASAIWAESPTSDDDAAFRSVAVTGTDAIASVGYITGTTVHNFGGSVVLNGTSLWQSGMIVFYDSSGVATAASDGAGADGSWFWSVSSDGGSGAYVAGYQVGANPFTYGSITGVTGPAFDTNAVVVRYNSQAEAQWVLVPQGATNGSQMRAVANDGATHVYAAGWQRGTSTYTYGTVDVTGVAAGPNGVLLRLDAWGNVLWGVTPAAGPGIQFKDVAVASDGSVYVVGDIGGSVEYDFGGATAEASGATAAGVLIKFNSSGTALWARTRTAGDGESRFQGVDVDPAGNVYVVGYQAGTDTTTYGTVEVQGPGTQGNALALKFDENGTALWGRVPTGGPAAPASTFFAVDASDSAHVYVAGTLSDAEPFLFGDVEVSGAAATATNALLVKYDSLGAAIWATSQSGSNAQSAFTSVALSGDILVASGSNAANAELTFAGVTITSWDATGGKALVVRYEP